MKAISLLQPHATLVAIGEKKIETRSRWTKYRGELLIHASAKQMNFTYQFRLEHHRSFKKYIQDFDALPYGAIIGKVDLIDVVYTESVFPYEPNENDPNFDEWHFGDYSPGRSAYILTHPVVFDKPIPAKGSIVIPWDFELPKDFLLPK